MKLIRNNNFNLYFPKRSGNLLWLLLMSFSLNSMAQIHVSENTFLSIKENTVFYTADETLKITFTDSEKENRIKKAKRSSQKAKKSNKPLQPPIVKKDTEPENGTGVLSFTSKQKEPSALFYSGKTTKAALVQSGNFGVKSFPPRKAYNTLFHTFLLDEDQQIKTSFAGTLPKRQIHLGEQITRPPPFLIKSYSEIS